MRAAEVGVTDTAGGVTVAAGRVVLTTGHVRRQRLFDDDEEGGRRERNEGVPDAEGYGKRRVVEVGGGRKGAVIVGEGRGVGGCDEPAFHDDGDRGDGDDGVRRGVECVGEATGTDAIGDELGLLEGGAALLGMRGCSGTEKTGNGDQGERRREKTQHVKLLEVEGSVTGGGGRRKSEGGEGGSAEEVVGEEIVELEVVVEVAEDSGDELGGGGCGSVVHDVEEVASGDDA